MVFEIQILDGLNKISRSLAGEREMLADAAMVIMPRKPLFLVHDEGGGPGGGEIVMQEHTQSRQKSDYLSDIIPRGTLRYTT